MLYWNIRNEFSEVDGFLFKGRQLIILKNMQSSIFDLIYESYFGIEKCKVCVRVIVYWFGMLYDIYDMVVKCFICLIYRYNNQKELMILYVILDCLW